MSTPQAPHAAATPPASTAKKGLPVLAWIAIGCGAMVILAGLVLGVVTLVVAKKAKDFIEDPEAVARLVIDAHPELEFVDLDAEAGVVTVRLSETGELVTLDFEDVKQGRVTISAGDKVVTFEAEGDESRSTLRVTGEDGEVGSLSFQTGPPGQAELPDWVPLYGGGEATGAYSMSSGEGAHGGFQMETEDSVQEVLAFYQETMKELGLEAHVSSFSSDDGSHGGMIRGQHPESGRSLQVIVGREDGPTTVAVTFTEGS